MYLHGKHSNVVLMVYILHRRRSWHTAQLIVNSRHAFAGVALDDEAPPLLQTRHVAMQLSATRQEQASSQT